MNHQNAGIVAGILAGGSSRRMGRPKALLEHPTGGTLIEYVYGVCRNITTSVVLLGELEDAPPTLSEVVSLPDVHENIGPLAGLCSLLEYAIPESALLVACDMPRISTTLIGRLMSPAWTEYDVRLFCAADQVKHTCCALYHPRILAKVRRAISQKHYSLQALIEELNVDCLRPSVDEAVHLMNINTPADYQSFVRSSLPH